MALTIGACSSVDSNGLGSVSDYFTSSKGEKMALPRSNPKQDAIKPDTSASTENKPVAELYNSGLELMKGGQYKGAIKKFKEVERQHPYSKWATRALIMQAYSEYQRNNYDNTIIAAKRFTTLHPGHKDAAYATYLIAISYYEQIGEVTRDASDTQKALAALKYVSDRYPGTQYARDAQAKAVLAYDHLAGKEMEVGRYYQKRKAYLAAINRFKRVVTDYQTTSHTPEALYRLTETYLALGIRSEAQTAAAILGHNYPDNEWYRDAYSLLTGKGLSPLKSPGSWLTKAFG